MKIILSRKGFDSGSGGVASPIFPSGEMRSGVFQRFTPELQLTAPHQSKSIWQLPAWFYPRELSSSLSYHRNLNRWKLDGERVLLHCVGRGQEFVLDCQEFPEAVQWLYQLLI